MERIEVINMDKARMSLGSAGDRIALALSDLRHAGLFGLRAREISLAITKLEEANMWLDRWADEQNVKEEKEIA